MTYRSEDSVPGSFLEHFQQPVDDGGRQEQISHRILLDGVEYGARIRLREHHDGAAAGRRGKAEQPGGVRHRGGGKVHDRVLGTVMGSHHQVRCEGRQASVGVHDTLRQARGAAGRGQRDDVVRGGAVGRLRGRVRGDPLGEGRAAAGPTSSGPNWTHCLTPGRRSRKWRASSARLEWKITSSASNDSSNWAVSPLGLAGLAGIQVYPERQMPRTQIQASGSLGARTAILAPEDSPEASSALAIRQDSSPASVKV